MCMHPLTLQTWCYKSTQGMFLQYKQKYNLKPYNIRLNVGHLNYGTMLYIIFMYAWDLCLRPSGLCKGSKCRLIVSYCTINIKR